MTRLRGVSVLGRQLAISWLLLVVGLAALAPLIATDQALYLRAKDTAAFRAAHTVLPGAVGSLLRTYVAEENPTASPAVLEELQGVRRLLDTLQGALPEDAESRGGPRAAVASLRIDLEQLVAVAPSEHAQDPTALRAQWTERARALRRELEPFAEGQGLLPKNSSPLLASLTPAEALPALAWVWGLLMWFLVRRGVRCWPLLFLGALLLGGASLALFGGQRGRAPKHHLAQSDVVRGLYPPLYYGVAETRLEEALRPPGPGPEGLIPFPGEPAMDSALRHPLGTDSLGRDLLVRMVHGGRVSLLVGPAAALILLVLGIAIGALAGFIGGRTDLVLSRLIEVVQCFPSFLLVLALVAMVGPSVWNLIWVLGVTRWTGVARLVRGEVLRFRQADFVTAARAAGLPPWRILLHHLLPVCLTPVWVAGTFAVASGLLLESGLAFLGLGTRVPTPSWGGLLHESNDLEHWWMLVFPGLVIFGTVLAVATLGEGLRRAQERP